MVTTEADDGNSVPPFVVGAVVGIILMMVVTCVLLHLNDGAWEREAAHKGAAEYDAITGAWRWKEDLPLPTQTVKPLPPELPDMRP